MNDQGRSPAPLQMPGQRHQRERPQSDREEFLRSPSSSSPGTDTRTGKPSQRLWLPCPLNATARGTPSETHAAESSQCPELGETIVNDHCCFMPLSLERPVVQQSITRTTQLKLEQLYAPWSAAGSLMFLLIHRALFPEMLPLPCLTHTDCY